MTQAIIDKMSELVGRPFEPSPVQRKQLSETRHPVAAIVKFLPDQVEAWRVKLAEQLGVSPDLHHLVPASAIADRVNLGLPTRDADKGGSDTSIENAIPGQVAFDIGVAVGGAQKDPLDFLVAIYAALFGRPPDEPGRAFYQGLLDAGVDPAVIVQDMLNNKAKGAT